MFKPNKDTADYYNKKTNDQSFLFDYEDKKVVYVGENIISFETSDKKVETQEGFNDVKYP